MIEAIDTIRPSPWASMYFAARRAQTKGAVMLTSTTASQSSSGNDSVEPRRAIPALLIRIRSPPNWSAAASITSSMRLRSATSSCQDCAMPPASRISSATRSAAAPSMSVTATCAPAPASASAAIRPSPPPAPVTSALSPSMRKSVSIETLSKPAIPASLKSQGYFLRDKAECRSPVRRPGVYAVQNRIGRPLRGRYDAPRRISAPHPTTQVETITQRKGNL